MRSPKDFNMPCTQSTLPKVMDGALIRLSAIGNQPLTLAQMNGG